MGVLDTPFPAFVKLVCYANRIFIYVLGLTFLRYLGISDSSGLLHRRPSQFS